MENHKYLLTYYKFSKKIILLLIIFFISACASPDNLIKENKIRPGMSKIDIESAIVFGSFWNQIFVPEAYREYFPKQKKEILSGTRKKVFYVFKRVNTQVKCGWLLCKIGNGYLEKTFNNYSDAISYVVNDEKIAAEKKPKKTITIIENDVETEVPDDEKMLQKLNELVKDYKSGKITEEEFISKKSELLN
jgi:hypothetical protein